MPLLRMYASCFIERISLGHELRLGLPILEKVVLAKFGEKRRKLYWVALISEAAGREPPFTK